MALAEAVKLADADVYLFEPRDTYRIGGGLSFGGGGEPAGSNPPNGAVIRYTLKKELGDKEDDAELTLEILDSDGEVLRTFSHKKAEKRAFSPWVEFFPQLAKPELLEAEQGMNRFVWDLRLPDAEIQDKAILWGVARGPRVPPGNYQVRLSLGDWSEIPTLIGGLRDERLYTRSLCLRALEESTGETFRFDPRASLDDRERAVARWEDWWLARTGEGLLGGRR